MNPSNWIRISIIWIKARRESVSIDNMNRLRHSRHRQVEFYSETQTNLNEKNGIASWKMKSILDIPSTTLIPIFWNFILSVNKTIYLYLILRMNSYTKFLFHICNLLSWTSRFLLNYSTRNIVICIIHHSNERHVHIFVERRK